MQHTYTHKTSYGLFSLLCSSLTFSVLFFSPISISLSLSDITVSFSVCFEQDIELYQCFSFYLGVPLSHFLRHLSTLLVSHSVSLPVSLCLSLSLYVCMYVCLSVSLSFSSSFSANR